MNFTQIKNYLDRVVNEYNTPGVDCIIYKEHQEVFRYFTGMSDIENNRTINGNELYLIFSMTKMITCVCALQLYEKGCYLMNDPISRYLPEFGKMKISQNYFSNSAAIKIASGASAGESVQESGDEMYAQNPITVRDLFTMSAGFDYDLKSECITTALAEGKKSTLDLVRAMSGKVLGFEPGTRYRYSLCHDVLGALIEVWSGKKLSEYMKENLFAPLGMKDSFFGVPKDETKLSRMAARYTYNEARQPCRLPLECVYNLSDEYESGGAGLTSSAEDYAFFVDALANGGIGKTGNRILNESTVKLMGMNHLTDAPLKDFYEMRNGYGYGLGVRTHLDKTQSSSLSPIGEFGWDGAAGAFSMVDRKNKLSLVYFQHIHNWELRIQMELRNILYSCME